MQNSQYGEWIFVRSIPNHVISYDLKPEGTRGEVGTRVALTREAHERFYCVANLVEDSICGVEVICGNVFPDFGEV